MSRHRRVVGALGLGVTVLSPLVLWLLLDLRDYSSAVRDDFESPPGAIQKLLFGGAVLGLVLLFAPGLFGLVRALRRPHRPS